MFSLNMKIITHEQVEEGASTRPEFLRFFGQGFVFSSGKNHGVFLKRDACGNHEFMYFYADAKQSAL